MAASERDQAQEEENYEIDRERMRQARKSSLPLSDRDRVRRKPQKIGPPP
jgi:hypothetical protein